MFKKHVIIVLFSLVVVLIGCAHESGRTPEESDLHGQQVVTEYENKLNELKEKAATRPADQEIIERQKKLEDSLKELKNALAKRPISDDSIVEGIRTTSDLIIPGSGIFVGLAGLALREIEKRKRQRQVEELTTTVEIAGGIRTETQKKQALQVQSEDTLQAVSEVKDTARDALKLMNKETVV